MSWARHLRKVHVSWHPFSAPATPSAWFGQISTGKVLEASPKIVVSKELVETSAAGAEPPPPETVLTFVDGSEQRLDLSGMKVSKSAGRGPHARTHPHAHGHVHPLSPASRSRGFPGTGDRPLPRLTPPRALSSPTCSRRST